MSRTDSDEQQPAAPVGKARNRLYELRVVERVRFELFELDRHGLAVCDQLASLVRFHTRRLRITFAQSERHCTRAHNYGSGAHTRLVRPWRERHGPNAAGNQARSSSAAGDRTLRRQLDP